MQARSAAKASGAASAAAAAAAAAGAAEEPKEEEEEEEAGLVAGTAESSACLTTNACTIRMTCERQSTPCVRTGDASTILCAGQEIT